MLYDKNYIDVLGQIKSELDDTRQKVAINVNKELILMYYRIGLKLKEKNNWGTSFIDTLSRDLKKEYPNIKGMSSRNLRYMQKFASVYKNDDFLQEVLAKLTWTHNIIIMDRVKDIKKKKWYAINSIENGWSSNVLIHQISTNLYDRQALIENKTSNFMDTLPKPSNELSLEIIKDPYIFDFVSTRKSMRELDLENALVENITKFLLELGSSFAFIGKQYHLEIDGEDYFIDLLFYNIKIHSYVVFELKITKFKPEYIGQLNFYVNAIDSLLKSNDDNATIGILLCKEKNKMSAEYSLKNINSPIAVSEYKYLEELPKYLNRELKDDLNE